MIAALMLAVNLTGAVVPDNLPRRTVVEVQRLESELVLQTYDHNATTARWSDTQAIVVIVKKAPERFGVALAVADYEQRVILVFEDNIMRFLHMSPMDSRFQ